MNYTCVVPNNPELRFFICEQAVVAVIDDVFVEENTSHTASESVKVESENGNVMTFELQEWNCWRFWQIPFKWLTTMSVNSKKNNEVSFQCTSIQKQ